MKLKKTLIAASVAIAATATTTLAGPLQERIDAGETIRIGFANIPLWGYPDEDGMRMASQMTSHPDACQNGADKRRSGCHRLGRVDPRPEGRAFRSHYSGMYILNSRCENVSFSEPVAKSGDGVLVPAGNPNSINNYADILEGGFTMVTGAGYNTVEAAKRVGIDGDTLMQVPGPTEMVAALKAGRADAAILTYFEASHLAEDHDEIELGDISLMPLWSQNFAGIGFRHEDQDFLASFNEALAGYIGTDEMMAVVTEHEYTVDHLPGDTTAEWACANR